MYDPTVFDNLKVIIEGYIYDLDIEGELAVSNRSDLVDLAKMSRKYVISFSDLSNQRTYVNIELEMKHSHLSGELLNTLKKPGCHIEVSFHEEMSSREYDELLFKKIKRCWGDENKIKLFVTKEVTSSTNYYHHHFQVCFNNAFGEEDIEQLLHIVDESISVLSMISKN